MSAFALLSAWSTLAHQECDGGKWGFDPAFGTIRPEPDMRNGSGVCWICGARLRLDVHGLIPTHVAVRPVDELAVVA
jgi:hypothetical protein